MDKYLKIFEPAMKKWLAEHYSPEEVQKRWERTVALDEKWIREEGDLGGKKNPMANNMLEAYAFFAFYDSVDRSFSPEDLQSMIDAAMGKSIRMLSRFDMNKLLRRRGIVKLFYRYLENYQKKAERIRGNIWGNTWKIRLNPEGHNKGLAFVYDTCPLNDFARRHGYIDFLPNLCYIDQITCSAAHGKLIRHKTLADETIAEKAAEPLFYGFSLPVYLLLAVFWLSMIVIQFKAFSGELTPYPKKARLFSVLVGAIPVLVLSAILGSGTALGAGIGTMFLSFGNAFMFGGLLATLPSQERFYAFEKDLAGKEST